MMNNLMIKYFSDAKCRLNSKPGAPPTKCRRN